MEFFRTLGIPLKRGRLFDETDRGDGPCVVIIDEALAERYWPGEEALGKRIRFASDEAPWHEIIGIVGNVKYDGFTINSPLFYTYGPQMFIWAPFAGRIHSLILRTEGDPLTVAPMVRQIIRDLDPELPVLNMRTMDQIIARSVAHPRFLMTLMGVFAGVALLLGCIGIYGVISYAVAQRTNEIGVRMAMGAERTDVVLMVVRQGMILSLVGVAVGLVGALVATRVMEGILFNISTRDPWAYGLVSIVVVVVALLASYLPARRASRVDPMQALRSE
jgi:predicted permease